MHDAEEHCGRSAWPCVSYDEQETYASKLRAVGQNSRGERRERTEDVARRVLHIEQSRRQQFPHPSLEVARRFPLCPLYRYDASDGERGDEVEGEAGPVRQPHDPCCGSRY